MFCLPTDVWFSFNTTDLTLYTNFSMCPLKSFLKHVVIFPFYFLGWQVLKRKHFTSLGHFCFRNFESLIKILWFEGVQLYVRCQSNFVKLLSIHTWKSTGLHGTQAQNCSAGDSGLKPLSVSIQTECTSFWKHTAYPHFSYKGTAANVWAILAIMGGRLPGGSLQCCSWSLRSPAPCLIPTSWPPHLSLGLPTAAKGQDFMAAQVPDEGFSLASNPPVLQLGVLQFNSVLTLTTQS